MKLKDTSSAQSTEEKVYKISKENLRIIKKIMDDSTKALTPNKFRFMRFLKEINKIVVEVS